MESELLRIKCPNCGAVLTIKKIAGLETKSIPCPVCKKASKYIDYKVPKQQYTPPNEMMTPPWEMKPTLTIQKSEYRQTSENWHKSYIYFIPRNKYNRTKGTNIKRHCTD